MLEDVTALPHDFKKFLEVEYYRFTKESLALDFEYDADLACDAYRICESTIYYSSQRSSMYALYHYISNAFSINFSGFTPTLSKGRELEYGKVYQPLFERRGNVLEVIDDVDYLKELIAWMGYNGCSDLFFTFFLWDSVKESIAEDIRIRGIEVTLGGHSLKYLLNKDELDVEAFSFDNNKELIQTIKNTVEEYDFIKRVSLWPEDVGIVDGNGDAFFEDYIGFTNALQDALDGVEAEHIVYNAGLSWDMLMPPTIPNFKAYTNALFAYWGRNYSEAIDSGEANQTQANEALKWWIDHQKTSGKRLTIFEYYSDFFMMSEFYGPMAHRIVHDIAWFKENGVDSIVNLQVPLIKGRHFESVSPLYDYKHLHNYNNYVYVRSLWGDSLEAIRAIWFSQFGEDAQKVMELVDRLETLLPQFTKFNVPSFPLRYVDMNTDVMDNVLSEIIECIDHTLSQDESSKPWHEEFKVLRHIATLYKNHA